MTVQKLGWNEVPLGSILSYIDERVALQDENEYLTITVKRRHGGLEIRERSFGYQIATKKQFRLVSGAFIISRVQCWHQAYAIVPDVPPNAIASTNYDQFAISPAVDARFFWWLSHSPDFTETVRSSASGVVIEKMVFNRDAWLTKKVWLPSLAEQQRIVARIEGLAAQIHKAKALRQEGEHEIRQMLLGSFKQACSQAVQKPMRDIAPLVRRPVKIDPSDLYPELGIRSFGKGTFHKPALTSIEIGNKRIFRIEPGDLLFSNVFAWEGAIAVARPEDTGRVGSHRFITCAPKPGIVTSHFLCFFFLTTEGLELIGAASPGGAGRNRTLGLTTLSAIQVPVPPIEQQRWFDALQSEADKLKRLQAETAAELDALLPSVLDRAFKGEL